MRYLGNVVLHKKELKILQNFFSVLSRLR